VSIEHDENFLLVVAVDASHGDIGTLITIDDTHAGHIERQNLLEVSGPTVMDHLFSNQCGRYRYLSQVLGLCRGSGDGCCNSLSKIRYQLGEAEGILQGGVVIWILPEHEGSVLFGFGVIVHREVTKREQSEDTDLEIGGE